MTYGRKTSVLAPFRGPTPFTGDDPEADVDSFLDTFQQRAVASALSPQYLPGLLLSYVEGTAGCHLKLEAAGDPDALSSVESISALLRARFRSNNRLD